LLFHDVIARHAAAFDAFRHFFIFLAVRRLLTFYLPSFSPPRHFVEAV